ncbi:MAG TPA: AAA family ATPase, partial [Holosporales bacterium]|nr:AAA family ATPase [Holosporales bacterium]
MQEELFDKPNPLPLAACLRPKNWEEFVGQKDLVGPGEILNEVRQNIRLPSFILWGPPG